MIKNHIEDRVLAFSAAQSALKQTARDLDRTIERCRDRRARVRLISVKGRIDGEAERLGRAADHATKWCA